jgi:hypothetical protein
MLSCHLYFVIPGDHFPVDFLAKILCEFISSRVYATSTTHLNSLDLINRFA